METCPLPIEDEPLPQPTAEFPYPGCPQPNLCIGDATCHAKCSGPSVLLMDTVVIEYGY